MSSAEPTVTQEEKRQMNRIRDLLKEKHVEDAITEINSLIETTRNALIKKEYGDLLGKLARSKQAVNPEQLFDVKVEKPTINFKDIRGMDRLKKALSKEIILMLDNRKSFLRHKLKPSGLLLYGPPGTGKSFFLEALAGEFNMSIIKPDLASLFSQWVGETEKNIIKIVQKAKENQPCMIMIDEVDAKIRNRANIEARGESVVNLNATTQFLETMQNVHNENQKILFTSASNRPWDVDPAAKRPGRFGNLIYIAPPGLKDRFIFFRSYLKTVEHLRISPFGYLRLSLATARYSPADIEEICILAKKEMLYRNVTGGKDYFNRKLTREEYLNESAAGTLPRKPKEILSTGDIIKIIKRDFRGSSLDAWYIESYKAMVGWEEIQKETSKGLILSKTIRRKVRHEGKFTKEEQKIYKPMLKDVKHARSRRFATSLVRGFARAV